MDTIQKTKIQNFTDLEVWKSGHALVIEIYRVTKNFPKDEQFELTSQIRRAAVSVTSNIAEGFSRQSIKEKVQFYSIAKGSLTEVENQLLISRDIEYISGGQYLEFKDKIAQTGRLLTGLLQKTKSFMA